METQSCPGSQSLYDASYIAIVRYIASPRPGLGAVSPSLFAGHPFNVSVEPDLPRAQVTPSNSPSLHLTSSPPRPGSQLPANILHRMLNSLLFGSIIHACSYTSSHMLSVVATCKLLFFFFALQCLHVLFGLPYYNVVFLKIASPLRRRL